MAKGLVPIAHPSNSLHVEPWSSMRTLVMSEMVLMVMAGGGGHQKQSKTDLGANAIWPLSDA